MEQSILNLEFKSSDLKKTVTIREFFFELMNALWEEKEYFNGKRPFGNIGWDRDIIKCLIENKLIDGKIDINGHPKYNAYKADKFILNEIIKPLFGK